MTGKTGTLIELENAAIMGSKINPGKFDCYANALPDEPMFVLLARDPYAPLLVSLWADLREKEIHDGTRPQSDFKMIDEAGECAESMKQWRRDNNGKWRADRKSA